MRKSGWIVLMACTAFVSTAALAESKEKQKNDDPNRVICEKQEVIGSRVATRRICKTAAEWAEERATDRQTIDKAQMQAQVPSGN